LEFCSIGGSIESMLQNPEWRDTLEGANFLKIVARMNQEMAAIMPDLLRDADLIVGGVSGLAGFSIAEKFNIPVIQAYLFPITPTRAFPGPLTPELPLGRLLNPLSFYVVRQMLWQSGRIGDVTIRKALGMPRASFWGPYRAFRQKRIPVLYGYSRHVLPRPDDWDDLHHVTGYWFLDPPASWTPPADLVDFLRAGAAPVYIGFGSMGSRDPEAAARLALRALELSGQRGIIASGWGGMSQTDLPDSVYMIQSAPHSWLFPQMAAVVHHGGAGTTGAGLRAGVPSIIVPFMADQPFWGQRVMDAGVGPAWIPRRQLTAERLAQAIQQAVSDTGMRQRAADLGEKIRAEDGVGQAVALIEAYARQKRGVQTGQSGIQP
jgi:sterol 3beta-glucosyltransferase